MSRSTDSSHCATGLLRQPHHQVEGEVVESCRARQTNSRFSTRRGMKARQTLQLLVAKRLHAVAETIDACVAEAGEPSFVDRFRIGLERDLGVGGKVERLATGIDDGRDLRRLEQRRRPAAEKNCVGRRSACPERTSRGRLRA
jgi:hypothetical protein